MFDRRLREQLREDLERPALVAPHPAQARYRLRASAAGRPGAVWLRAGSAFAVAAVVAGVLLSAGTGSTNPRIWTVRVASALSQLTEAPTPNAQPPVASPSEHEGSTNGGSPTIGPDDKERGAPVTGSPDDAGKSPSPSPSGDERRPAPSPSPDERGSGGPAPDAGGHGSANQQSGSTPAKD